MNPTCWAPSSSGSSSILAGPLRPEVIANTAGFFSAAPADASTFVFAFFPIFVDFLAVCLVRAMRNVLSNPIVRDLPAFIVEGWPACFAGRCEVPVWNIGIYRGVKTNEGNRRHRCASRFWNIRYRVLWADTMCRQGVLTWRPTRSYPHHARIGARL